MSDPLVHAEPAPTASVPEFVAVFAAILAVIVAVAIFDAALARADRRESASHAASLYEEGRALLARGDPGEAEARFASAFAMERSNPSYELALAQAQMEAGRLDEAEATLGELLSRTESDGAVNIAMARVLVRRGRPNDAKAYYHRAIYGRWRGDSLEKRMSARLELIDLLARERSAQELLAELLPVAEAMPDSAPLEVRIGRLFIVAGSPARGASLLRTVLREHPDDGDAYLGMGEAALALGNFRTAQSDFMEAARRLHDDAPVRPRLAVADTARAIDPAERKLSVRERYVRARALLARTIALAHACKAARGADVVRTGWSALAATPADVTDTESDRLLALASDAFDAVPPACIHPDSPAEEALALVQAHLGG